MKVGSLGYPIMRTWLAKEGCRLDARPFLSGAIEAKKLIERLPAVKKDLSTITKGHKGGIYNGPIFVRNYVDSDKYGIPFITSGSMLLSDLSRLSFLSKKDAYSSKLTHLRVEEGMTLISCSGTIGKMVYARPDMHGIWSSQDVMKVNPDPSKIEPGFLYAFLSSKFGVPLVTSNTYGAIIQHIEPKHIANLPVPIPTLDLAERVHKLVDDGANHLSRYQALIKSATELLFDQAHINNPKAFDWTRDKRDLGFTIQLSELGTFRAFNHSLRVRQIWNQIKSGGWSPLGDLVDLDWLKWRKMFQRIDADPEYGVEVLTQKPLFQLKPEGRWVSRKYLLSHSPKYLVPDQTVLIAKQGTLGEDELFCRCEFVTGKRMLERAYSDHCMRLVALKGRIQPGYLFAFLRSDAGFRLLRSLSEGSKQQDIHFRTIANLPIPRCDENFENQIHEMMVSAYDHRNKGIDLEEQARRLVEEWIERGE